MPAASSQNSRLPHAGTFRLFPAFGILKCVCGTSAGPLACSVAWLAVFPAKQNTMVKKTIMRIPNPPCVVVFIL